MNTRQRIRNYIQLSIIAVLCALTLVLDFIDISYTDNVDRNRFIGKIVQQSLGSLAAIFLMIRLKIHLFNKPQYWLYLIPCLIIAIDNFQFSSYFKGNMQLVNGKPLDFILFGGYCLAVGLFEECIFRGIIFSVLASCFSYDKKGLWKTYIVSSALFGAAHLFNGLSVATILQIGYSTLTGGLFAFVLLKTKNIFCCAFVHAVYNFCGLLFEIPERMGLGSGVVFDLGTAITMLIVCVIMGAFILYSVFKYSDDEVGVLYEKLGIPPKKETKAQVEEQETFSAVSAQDIFTNNENKE